MTMFNRRARSTVIAELTDRLTSLDQHCLTDLERGLQGMQAGDLTVEAKAVTTPITARSGDPDLDGLVEIFNRMLGTAQNAVDAYGGVREGYRATLGDHSSLAALDTKLAALNGNCLNDLERGMAAINAGDLTISVAASTTPITTAEGVDAGSLATTFNDMLGRAQAALEGYEEMRQTLRVALGDQSTLAQLSTRLESLNGNCLTNLELGLAAMNAGDMTVAVTPVTTPITGAEGASIGTLSETFNEMLGRAQTALVGYNTVRETVREALGDQSCLDDLLVSLDSLDANCLTNLQLGLGKMAQGDLTHEVVPVTSPVGAHDGAPVGRLGATFNQMLARMVQTIEGYNGSRAQVGGMIGQVSETATTLLAASQQMASTSEEAGRAVGEIAHAVSDVAQGAERQARTVESTRELTQEVTTATQEGTANVAETATAAAHARELAQEGVDAVELATTAMSAVRESSTTVTQTIRHLGEKSGQIGGIVDTITGIAGQTNLLALNAAIEAARAGEQGRGFAVVAEQVRKLAEESQAAAASIAGLISEIQSETARAVEVVEDGAQRTEDGAATVGQARDAFMRIGSSVEDMHGRVDQIAAVMQQIAASSARVQEDMTEVAAIAEQSSASSEQVSASTQETSASTQEIAASAQELARTAEELEELCGRFTMVGV